MLRRPPSVIPLQQSDIDDVQRFLARKVAAAKAQAGEDSVMEDSANEASTQQGVETSNAKGKGRAQPDEPMQQEEQGRQTRSQATREQRIGI